MPALTAQELTDMRLTEEEYMPSTCVIERRTLTADGMGGFTEAWAAVGTVDCDLYPMGGSRRESISGEQLTVISRWTVVIPQDSDVQAEDRMLIDNRTFEVNFVPNDADHQSALTVETTAFNETKRST